MNKILCFGSSCKDIFFPTSEGEIIETPGDLLSQKKIAFELGAKYKIQERHEALGGCAANVAVGLARLGIKNGCVSKVGDDEIGSWILSELKKNKVGTELVVKQKNKKSDLSAIIVDSASSDRTIFSNKNSDGNLKIDAKKTKDCHWFFLGDIHGKWEDQLEEIIQLAQNEKKLIAFNPREIHIHEDPMEIVKAISLCEIVFVNKDEALEIVSKMNSDVSLEEISNEKFLLEKLASLEPSVVVITDGKNGAWSIKEGRIFYAKSLEVPAVDSTGAGDAFCSGFLSAYIKSKEIGECLKWGIANSASEVQHYGAIDGLLKEKEILEEAKKVEVEEL